MSCFLLFSVIINKVLHWILLYNNPSEKKHNYSIWYIASTLEKVMQIVMCLKKLCKLHISMYMCKC